MKKGRSPYLENDRRLSDVIAAIQAMGSYPWFARKLEDWKKKLGEPQSADSWGTIFKEHPEFFRLSDEGWGSLRWRYAYDKTYDARAGKLLTDEEKERLSPQQRDALTRKPLDAAQIETLLKTAIELHSRAIAHKQETRWWVTVLLALLAAIFGLLGAVVSAVLKSAPS